MCKPNTDLRVLAMKHGVLWWQIARELGISACTMSRKLRTELNPVCKKEVEEAIVAIASRGE